MCEHHHYPRPDLVHREGGAFDEAKISEESLLGAGVRNRDGSPSEPSAEECGVGHDRIAEKESVALP